VHFAKLVWYKCLSDKQGRGGLEFGTIFWGREQPRHKLHSFEGVEDSLHMNRGFSIL
jgi:hypothetical protein